MDKENIFRQRAALMGLLVSIFRDNSEGLTALQIKNHCAQALSYMIEQNLMVGDFVDLMTVEACQEFCEQEKAIEDANDILRGE